MFILRQLGRLDFWASMACWTLVVLAALAWLGYLRPMILRYRRIRFVAAGVEQHDDEFLMEAGIDCRQARYAIGVRDLMARFCCIPREMIRSNTITKDLQRLMPYRFSSQTSYLNFLLDLEDTLCLKSKTLVCKWGFKLPSLSGFPRFVGHRFALGRESRLVDFKTWCRAVVEWLETHTVPDGREHQHM